MEKMFDVMVYVVEDLSIYLDIDIYSLPKKPNLPHHSAVATPQCPVLGLQLDANS